MSPSQTSEVRSNALQDCPFLRDLSTAQVFWTWINTSFVEVYDQENLAIQMRGKWACVGATFQSVFILSE